MSVSFGQPSMSFGGLPPHFPLAPTDFPGGTQPGGEEFTGDMFQQQQQMLAAQQLQLQLLQAQLVQQQLAAQQQRDQGFIAPRFQALAAQRAAVQQQQQQTAQLAEAQRLFEMHQQQQQQMLLAQQPLESGQAPPVFEEDSPEPTPASLGPTGRPQLNPGFTFGKRRESAVEKKPRPSSMFVNREEAANSLAGLAARAHKRAGSEMSSALEEQVSIASLLRWLTPHSSSSRSRSKRSRPSRRPS